MKNLKKLNTWNKLNDIEKEWISNEGIEEDELNTIPVDDVKGFLNLHYAINGYTLRDACNMRERVGNE